MSCCLSRVVSQFQVETLPKFRWLLVNGHTNFGTFLGISVASCQESCSQADWRSMTLSAIKAKERKSPPSIRLQRKVARNSAIFEPIKAKPNKPCILKELSHKQGYLFATFAFHSKKWNCGSMTQLDTAHGNRKPCSTEAGVSRRAPVPCPPVGAVFVVRCQDIRYSRCQDIRYTSR
jgi:hypothetical protein